MKNKKTKYYLRSNIEIPRPNRKQYYIGFWSRKSLRTEQRQKLWIDLVQYIISIPQQNVILLYAYLTDKKNDKYCTISHFTNKRICSC